MNQETKITAAAEADERRPNETAPKKRKRLFLMLLVPLLLLAGGLITGSRAVTRSRPTMLQ